MSIPSEIADDAENADIGRHGCLLPTGDASDWHDGDANEDDEDDAHDVS